MYVDKWTKIGLDTTPFDLETARSIIDPLYTEILNKEKPKHIFILDNPLHAWIAIFVCLGMFNEQKIEGQLRKELQEQVWDKVRKGVVSAVVENIRNNVAENVVENVRKNVAENVVENVRNNVVENVRDKVWDYVQVNVRDNVVENVAENVRDKVWDNVRENVRESVRENVAKKVWDYVAEKVRDYVWNNVTANVWNNVLENVRNNVLENVRNNVVENVRDKVWDNVWYNVWENVWNNVLKEIQRQIQKKIDDEIKRKVHTRMQEHLVEQARNFIWPYLDGNFSTAFFSFYDYFFSEGLVENTCESWNILKKTSKLSLIYPLDDFCICCQKPVKISMKDKKLHCDGGPAVEYREDFKIWCLNGVSVPQNIVETPAEDLDCSLILKEKNIEIRKEIIRKIGIERILTELGGEVLEQDANYALLNLDLKDGRKRPYLKMLNPSTGAWHIEGVAVGVKTIGEALSWRNKTSEIPIILT